jgi:hypothetical protein
MVEPHAASSPRGCGFHQMICEYLRSGFMNPIPQAGTPGVSNSPEPIRVPNCLVRSLSIASISWRSTRIVMSRSSCGELDPTNLAYIFRVLLKCNRAEGTASCTVASTAACKAGLTAVCTPRACAPAPSSAARVAIFSVQTFARRTGLSFSVVQPPAQPAAQPAVQKSVQHCVQAAWQNTCAASLQRALQPSVRPILQ